MGCEHYLMLFSARLDGELSPEEERELDAHLEQCPDCRLAARELEQVHLALCALGEITVPEDFTARVMEQVKRESRPAIRRRLIRQAAGLAACLLLCVGAYRLAQPKAAADQPPAAAYRSVQGADAASSVWDQELDEGDLDVYALPSPSPASPEDGPEEALKATGGPVEPDFYAFQNVQNFQVQAVSLADTPQNSATAQILGSTQALSDFAAQFPEEELLTELTVDYDAEFFQTNRLLAVVAEGSEPPQLEAQGLFRKQVMLERSEESTEAEKVSVWVVVAEVDSMFDDGDALSVLYTDQSDS